MKFKWERLVDGTVRAKVIGGWVLCTSGFCSEAADEVSSSMVFIPDPNHDWEIKV